MNEPRQAPGPEERDRRWSQLADEPLPPRQALAGVGRDQEQGAHAIRMPASEHLRGRSAMGVAHDMGGGNPESVQGGRQVGGHRLGGVWARQVRTPAVAAQIWHDNMELLGQRGRKEGEFLARGPQAVQEDNGGTIATLVDWQDRWHHVVRRMLSRSR